MTNAKKIQKQKTKTRKTTRRGGKAAAASRSLYPVARGSNPWADSGEHSCIRDFLAARIGALGYAGGLPCNPRYDPGYSVRGATYSRGTFYGGTSGNAFIVANALQMLQGNKNVHMNSADYDQPGIICTTAVGQYAVATPFVYSNSNVAVAGKLVGYQMAIWATGKTLDTSGTVYRLRTPENIRINGNNIYADTDIFNNPEVHSAPVQKGQRYVTNFVTRNSQHDDSYVPNTIIRGDATDGGAWDTGFYIAGIPKGYSFDYEIRGFYEYSSHGGNIGQATYSPVYSAGAARVETANAQLMATPSTVTEAGYWQQAGRVIREHVAPAVVDRVLEKLPGVAAGAAAALSRGRGTSLRITEL